MNKKIAGITLNDEKGTFVYAEYDGRGFNILQKLVFLTANDYSTVEMVLDRLDEFLSMVDFESAGINCNGIIDSKNGIIKSIYNLPVWDNVRICEHFEEKFRLPCKLNTDIDARALAESKLGAGKGYDSIIYLNFGKKTDISVIQNGKSLSDIKESLFDADDMKLLLQLKCVDEGITHPLQEKADLLSALDIFEYAEKGDELANEILNITAEKLTQSCVALAEAYNPQIFILDSIYTRYGDLLCPLINKIAEEKYDSKIKLLPAKLGESIGDYGALMTALF